MSRLRWGAAVSQPKELRDLLVGELPDGPLAEHRDEPVEASLAGLVSLHHGSQMNSRASDAIPLSRLFTPTRNFSSAVGQEGARSACHEDDSIDVVNV